MEKVCCKLLIWHMLALGMIATVSHQGIAAPTWQNTTTPHFDILSPLELERQAHRVANTLEHIYIPTTKSLGLLPKRITFILRNQSTISNGHLIFRPQRVNLFTFPTQDQELAYANDWLSLLCIHEFRHVAQASILHQGFNKFLYQVAGEGILPIWKSLLIPSWFYEGDAVGIETALTKGGRGRIPYFSLLYKANLLEKGGFSYQKQLLGSYQDNVPSYYKMGYYLTTYLRRRYGPKIVAYIFQLTTQPLLFPLAIRKATGKSLLTVYEDANRELKKLWTQQLQGLNFTPVKGLNKRATKSTYTNYSYPQAWANQIIALKQGLETAPQLVIFDKQAREQLVLRLGNMEQAAGFSVAQAKLLWIEQIPDLRWEEQSYSVIQVYNSSTKKLQTLTPKNRYAAASFSPDASKIVALESDKAYNHQILILDSESGKVLQRLPNANNYYYLNPRFSPDGQSIIAIKHADPVAAIVLIHLESGISKEILCSNTEQLGWPIIIGNYVFYHSSYSGIDNIYALDLKTHRQFQVTSSKYGAYYPSIGDREQTMLYNDFTKDGMDIVKLTLDPISWTPIEKVPIRSVNYYEPLIEQEGNPNVLQGVPKQKFPSKSYPTGHHLIKIHSWLPYCNLANFNGGLLSDTPFNKNVLGFMILSNNLLNTADWITNYEYNFTDRTNKLSTKFTYKGWYPNLTLGSQLTTYRQSGYIKLFFPLNWSKKEYNHKLSFHIRSKIYQELYDKAYMQTYKVHFIRAATKSLRDIKHPWLQSLETFYRHTPYQSRQMHMLNTTVRLHFPGLLKHHMMGLIATYQYIWPCLIGKNELISIQIPRPSQQNIHIKFDYYLPISYPDWSTGLAGYLIRISSKLFYHITYPINQFGLKTSDDYCLGGILNFEYHLFNFPLPFNIGIVGVYNRKNNQLILKASKLGKINWGFILSYGQVWETGKTESYF